MRSIQYLEDLITRLGRAVACLLLVMVTVQTAIVLLRYGFDIGSIALQESVTYLHATTFMLGAAFTLQMDGHVRVDIFYAPMSRPKKAWVDLVTSIFFFIFAGTLLVTSWIFAMDAIAVPSGNSVVSDWARGQIGLGEMFGGMGLNQWTDPNIRWGEISFNEWEVPLWPMKWVMVMGGLLLVLQGVSKLSKDIREIARGN